jgi:hypothetical protein
MVQIDGIMLKTAKNKGNLRLTLCQGGFRDALMLGREMKTRTRKM